MLYTATIMDNNASKLNKLILVGGVLIYTVAGLWGS